MARGVYNLSQVRRKSVLNEWDSNSDVWIFPDNDGAEFKYVDGTVTAAPAATPAPLTTAGGVGFGSYGIIRPPSSDPNFGHKIVSRYGKVAIASNKKVYLYDLSEEFLQETLRGKPTLKLELTIDPAASSTIEDIALNSSNIFLGISTAVYRYDLDGTNELIIPGSVSAIDASETHIVVGRDSSDASAVITTVNGTSPVTLTPSLTGSTNTYGYAVGISTNRVVVGDHASSGTFINGSSGTNTSGGASYLYDLSGTEIAKLDRKNEVSNPSYDNFGYSIAVDDAEKVVYIGAPSEYGVNENVGGGVLTSRGAIFCFDLTTGALIGKYAREDAISQDDKIGASIAVNRETTDLSIYYTAGGDYSSNNNSSIYSRKVFGKFYEVSNTSSFQPSTVASMDEKTEWGHRIKVAGSKVITTTDEFSSTPIKYLYAYNLDGSGEVRWTSSHNPGDGSDDFGYSFDSDGTKIVVGAPGATVNSISESGRAYIYNMNGTGEISLQPSGTQPANGWGKFGHSVAVGPIKGSNGARRIVVLSQTDGGSGYITQSTIFIFNDSGTELSRYTSSLNQEQWGFNVVKIQPEEDGGNIIIGGWYGWYIFDPQANSIIKTTVWRNTSLSSQPLVSIYLSDGNVMAKNGHIIIGYPMFNYSNNPHLSSSSVPRDVGRVDIFDKSGNPKYEKWSPNLGDGARFGDNVDIVGNTLYVSSDPSYNTSFGHNINTTVGTKEDVHAIDLATGNFLDLQNDIQSPYWSSSQQLYYREGFGEGLAVTGDNTLYIGNASNNKISSSYTKNTIYVFTPTGNLVFQENIDNRYYVSGSNQFARSVGVSTVSASLTQQLDTPYDNGGAIFMSEGEYSDSVRFYGRESASPNDEGIFSGIYHYRQPII